MKYDSIINMQAVNWYGLQLKLLLLFINCTFWDDVDNNDPF